MRIGILADVHEAIDPLTRALEEFHALGVDLVVSLGDSCDTFTPVGRTAETVTLLREARAVGVWGNHDFGLCHDVPDKVRQSAAPEVLEYMAGMQPWLVVEDCRFSHVEPWLDAYKVEDLWFFEGVPDTPEKAARSFAAVPERHLFIGHLHRWLAVTPRRRIEWAGETPLDLAEEPRSLVVIAPVVSGWCAIFDTTARRLTPIRCEA